MKYSLSITIVVSGICFLMLLGSEMNLAAPIIMCVVTGLVLFFSLKFQTSASKNRHQKVFRSEGFQTLLKNGFSMVAVNDYLGIAGIYNGYYVDIYFDWAAHVTRMNQSAIVLQVYFNAEDNMKDMLSDLNKKLIPPIFSGNTYRFEYKLGYLKMENRCGINYLSSVAYYQALDKCVELLKENNFQPLSQEELFKRRENYSGVLIPEISLYSV